MSMFYRLSYKMLYIELYVWHTVLHKVRQAIQMTKAVGYIRVSTQEQAKHGYSIHAQIDKVKAVKAYANL